MTRFRLKGLESRQKSRQHISIVDYLVVDGSVDASLPPLEYLLVSLAGCIMTIGHIITRQQRLLVRKTELRNESKLNTDGLMGKKNGQARYPISDSIYNLEPIEFIME